MRQYGALPGTLSPSIPVHADTVQHLVLAGGVAQAMDWPSTGGVAGANSRENACQIVRFTGQTSAGGTLNFYVNVVSANAGAPTSGSSVTTGTTAGSTGNLTPINGQGTLQIPGWSTGWSAYAGSSGFVTAEIWRR